MKNLKTVVIAVLCAGLCLGYYYYLVHRDSGKEEAITEADMIITQDLDDSYPKTARGVVKFYNRILKCYYSQDYTEEQLEKMTAQARKLYHRKKKRLISSVQLGGGKFRDGISGGRKRRYLQL